MKRNGWINSSDVKVEISVRFVVDWLTVGLRKTLGIENVPEYLAWTTEKMVVTNSETRNTNGILGWGGVMKKHQFLDMLTLRCLWNIQVEILRRLLDLKLRGMIHSRASELETKGLQMVLEISWASAIILGECISWEV